MHRMTRYVNCCGMFPSFHLIKGLVSITSCSESVNLFKHPDVAQYFRVPRFKAVAAVTCRVLWDVILCCWVSGKASVVFI